MNRLLLGWLHGKATHRTHVGTEHELIVAELPPKARWRVSWKGRLWRARNRDAFNARCRELYAQKDSAHREYKARKAREYRRRLREKRAR